MMAVKEEGSVIVEAGLTAGDLARRLGVSVTTLRTWHQRYGLGPRSHVTGRHRRYAEADVARMEIMRRLTGRGVPAAEAARAAIRGTGEPSAKARAGGGLTIPVGRTGPEARGLARAAMRLDTSTMIDAMTASIRAHGIIKTWDRMLRPVLVGIGDRHAATKRLVEVEHLLSRSISEVLAAVRRPSDDPARALLACADEEQHSLPIEALSAALAERGYGSRLLGARVPSQALTDAVRRTGPGAVVVWSHAASTADPRQLRRLAAVRPRPILLAAAGPGWAERRLPAGYERPADLTAAVDLVISAVRL
jgi:DNA-binding transcriptional MerR regulator